jgi:glycosyltransferase involved in cell wall biosynthesis
LIEGKFGRFYYLSGFSKLNFFLSQLDLVLCIFKIIKKNKIKIVRAEDPYYNGILAFIFAKLFRLPLMIGVWGNPANIRQQTKKPLMPRLFRWIWVEEIIERFILRKADLVLVQNEDNRSFVLQKGVPFHKTWIFKISNVLHECHWIPPLDRIDGSIDLLEFNIQKNCTLLCISRLEELKHLDHLIHIVKHIKDNGRSASLLLVGDGSLKEELRNMAIRLGVSSQIIFCGNRDQEWISRVVPKVNVVLSPLTGRALGEVALGGAPVVAYDIDWHSEIVKTNDTGILVPYLDYKKMAKAVEFLLSNPNFAIKLGKNLRNLALKNLNPRDANQIQINAYELLLRTIYP